MIKKIKIRDLTKEQILKFCHERTRKFDTCSGCPLHCANCFENSGGFLVENKDMFSDEFLNQEVEIETDILTPKEKVYLEAVIDPFKERIVGIGKAVLCGNTEFIYFSTREKADEIIYSELPPFDAGTAFKGMEAGKKYTLEELGL